MTKRDVAWLFAVIFLSAALVLSVVLGVTGFFSSAVYLKSQTDLVVGDTLVIAVEKNASTAVSCTFDGAYFPNEQIAQVVQISALNCDVDQKIRVRSFVSSGDASFSFVTSEHFSLENGFYVYDGLLEHGTKTTFCTALVTAEGAKFVSGERYVLTIVVEALESDFADEIWGV